MRLVINLIITKNAHDKYTYSVYYKPVHMWGFIIHVVYVLVFTMCVCWLSLREYKDVCFVLTKIYSKFLGRELNFAKSKFGSKYRGSLRSV